MRIALINPVVDGTQGYHTVGSFIPQLGLQVLAQLVPDEHRVDIIDEVFGTHRTEIFLQQNGYDLVGVTSYSSTATRAYEIAEHCRNRKIPCIMGGSHASACPEEAARYFDSVAVGECDEVWPEILRDAAGRQMKSRYDGTLSDLETHHFGRANQSLPPLNGRYDVAAIQTSRGCPVGCEYCSVTRFNGALIRRRAIADIIEEWNQISRPFVFVVDDNFFGIGARHAEWSKELLRALIKHGKRRQWFSQTTLNMGEDDEALQLAYRAGCRGMLIGFETFNPLSLQNYHKGINQKHLDNYQDLVNGFHRAGIAVFGAFIIGSDEDTPETVAETALSAVHLGVDIIQITNLTPLPGTRMFEKFESTGRLTATNFPDDWKRYTFIETVYQPKNMTAGELDEAIYELRRMAANKNWVLKRAFRTLVRTRSIPTALFVLGMNRGWKKLARTLAPCDAQRFGATLKNSPRLEKIDQAFQMNLRTRLIT